MGRTEDLARAYERHISAPWLPHLAGAQREIFLVYDKEDERRVRAKKQLFELATRRSGHSWHEFDFTSAFPEWMAAEEYREAYFESPDALELKLDSEFVPYAASRLRAALTAAGVDQGSVVGAFGAGTLFGLTRLSLVLEEIEADIRGRLAVFFPGRLEDGHYRLLDARDGWTYLAIPITAHQGEESP